MTDKLMEAILKVAEKLQTNRYMSAIRNAFTPPESERPDPVRGSLGFL